jgi:hypothetical protein
MDIVEDIMVTRNTTMDITTTTVIGIEAIIITVDPSAY